MHAHIGRLEAGCTCELPQINRKKPCKNPVFSYFFSPKKIRIFGPKFSKKMKLPPLTGITPFLLHILPRKYRHFSSKKIKNFHIRISNKNRTTDGGADELADPENKKKRSPTEPKPGCLVLNTGTASAGRSLGGPAVVDLQPRNSQRVSRTERRISGGVKFHPAGPSASGRQNIPCRLHRDPPLGISHPNPMPVSSVTSIEPPPAALASSGQSALLNARDATKTTTGAAHFPSRAITRKPRHGNVNPEAM